MRPGRPGPSPPVLEVSRGLASHYGFGFEGRATASGVRFDQSAMVAAHPTYPFGTEVRVTNLANGRRVVVRVIDRGPAKGPRAKGVVIDLSSGAARKLDFLRQGRTRVRLDVLRWGSVSATRRRGRSGPSGPVGQLGATTDQISGQPDRVPAVSSVP